MSERYRVDDARYETEAWQPIDAVLLQRFVSHSWYDARAEHVVGPAIYESEDTPRSPILVWVPSAVADAEIGDAGIDHFMRCLVTASLRFRADE